MSYGPGARSSNAYHPASTSTSTSASTSHLQARIAQKRAELTHLQSLRDSSATLASQLSVLETKLSTLKDGAQSVALVLANWDNVLRAIGMAACEFSSLICFVLGCQAQGEKGSISFTDSLLVVMYNLANLS